MKPVDQIIIDKDYGDCTRATVASILELHIEAVPNFPRLPPERWCYVMNVFFWALGYSFRGTGYPPHPDRIPGITKLCDSPNIDGYVIASVASKTLGEGVTHSVVIDLKGVVVHDPNPNKLWQGEDILKSGDLISWLMFEPKEEEDGFMPETEDVVE